MNTNTTATASPVSHKIQALLQREWLQHRTVWALLVAVPFLLAVLGLSFGQVSLTEAGTADAPPEVLPTALTAGAVLGSSMVLFLVALVGSLVMVSGLARRDHGDRSVEFWLSMPTSHRSHFGVPLAVHLLLVPAAALVIGWCLGWIIAALLGSRVVGFGAWAAQPWGDVLLAGVALLARLLAGLPMALLWLAPILLLVVLLNAYVGRWALGLFALIIGLGSLLSWQVFKSPLPWLAVEHLFDHAAVSMIGASGGLSIEASADKMAAFKAIPGWLVSDYGVAVRNLLSPLLAGGLLFAAACFAGLLHWRRRGAGA